MFRFSTFTRRYWTNIININYYIIHVLFVGIGVKKIVKGPIYILFLHLFLLWVLYFTGMMPEYLKARFSTIYDPFSSSSGTGYHLSNSLMAMEMEDYLVED